MYITNPDIFTPSPNTTIWKYLNLEKLLSLLTSSTLYLRRIDCFKDPWEGLQNEGTKNAYKALMDQKQYDLTENFYRRNRAFFYADCWHESNYESAALWDLYANSAGVAIKSTIAQLTNAIKNTPSEQYIGKIKYIDYSSDDFYGGNAMHAGLLKRLSFEHEKEVRLFEWHPVLGTNPDTSSLPKSISIPISITDLTSDVFVSPNAEDWLAKPLEVLFQKFGLDSIKVHHSKLYQSVK